MPLDETRFRPEIRIVRRSGGRHDGTRLAVLEAAERLTAAGQEDFGVADLWDELGREACGVKLDTVRRMVTRMTGPDGELVRVRSRVVRLR